MVLDIFKNIKYDVHYKGIFSLFGIIFVLTLFYYDLDDFPNKIQLLCLISIGYSVIAWFIHEMMTIWERQMNELRGRMDIDYIGNLKKVTLIHTIPFIVYIIIFFTAVAWK